MITGGQFIDFAGKLAARQATTEAEQRRLSAVLTLVPMI